MPNKAIRLYAFEKDVKMYQIADKLGIHYVTLNSKLRNKLSKEERLKLFSIINEISKEKGDEKKDEQR